MSEQAFTLTLYVPTAVDEGTRGAVDQMAAKEHGGFTRVEADGGWVNERGDLVEESVHVYTIHVDADYPLYGDSPTAYAEHVADWIRRHSDETAVLAAVDTGETAVMSES